jgi:hypothetical protein
MSGTYSDDMIWNSYTCVEMLVTELARYERDVVAWKGDVAGPFVAYFRCTPMSDVRKWNQ